MGPAIVIMSTLELDLSRGSSETSSFGVYLILKRGASLFAFAEGPRNTDSGNTEKFYHKF